MKKDDTRDNPVIFFLFVTEGHLFPDRGVISSFSSDQSQMQPNESE